MGGSEVNRSLGGGNIYAGKHRGRQIGDLPFGFAPRERRESSADMDQSNDLPSGFIASGRSVNQMTSVSSDASAYRDSTEQRAANQRLYPKIFSNFLAKFASFTNPPRCNFAAS